MLFSWHAEEDRYVLRDSKNAPWAIVWLDKTYEVLLIQGTPKGMPSSGPYKKQEDVIKWIRKMMLSFGTMTALDVIEDDIYKRGTVREDKKRV
jgi:hypothetical protein